jgi:NADPH:quinone reductase-like Zn-dependent oxidoreductase
MPKFVRFYETGGPEVLRFEEGATPQPGNGEVRLKVQAIGLNRADSMFYHGQYMYEPKFPATLGYEAAGVVEAVGPDVDKSWVGKKVSTIPAFSLNNYGMVGEEVLAPVASLGEYPGNLSPIQGTAIWMQYVTVCCGLIDLAGVKKGEFVVITAASSSVGIAAIELLRAEGAVSIAMTRERSKKEEVAALGADYVIATEEEDFVARVMEITGGKGVRVIFDPISGPFLEKLIAVAQPGGIIIEYSTLAGEPKSLSVTSLIAKSLTIRGYTMFEFTLNPERLQPTKKYVYDKLASGQFVPKIAKTFPFAQAVEAYRYLESNQQVGKIVVTVP